MELWGITYRGAVRQREPGRLCRAESRRTAWAVAVVCDGMGGARAGDVASAMAVETFDPS